MIHLRLCVRSEADKDSLIIVFPLYLMLKSIIHCALLKKHAFKGEYLLNHEVVKLFVRKTQNTDDLNKNVTNIQTNFIVMIKNMTYNVYKVLINSFSYGGKQI